MTDPVEGTVFAGPQHLRAWLAEHHATQPHLWVRLFKKGTGEPSVTWEDCVIQSIAWGWIDGLKRPLDDRSWLQRLSPRKPRSAWSDRNRAHAERLIAEGGMMPAGMIHVEQARADGRWTATYAGSADMVIPDDFLLALNDSPAAKAFFETLDRKNLFPIYYRLQTARKPATRAARLARIIDQLARGEKFH